MFFYFLIAVLGLVVLMAIHELGHFLLAKKMGLKVDEFGIGLPPRLIGKKIGQTIYSLNWLPFGAFVKIPELENSDRDKSKSISAGKQALVLLGGVVATWIAAFVIFTIIAGVWGLSFVTDSRQASRVQIMSVQEDSPAEEAGMLMGDIILSARNGESVAFDGIDSFTDYLGEHRGQEITLTIRRGKEVVDLPVKARSAEEAEEKGALGVVIASTTHERYKWHQAPWAGLKATASQTVAIPLITAYVVGELIQGNQVPGARLAGPVGIVQMAGEQAALGWDRLLMLMAMIAIYFTIFNLLPIPALDGGRLLFLGIEKIFRKNINPVIENKINTAFFFLLIGLLIFVTVKDFIHIFN
jgi:regulator of sigma E protease